MRIFITMLVLLVIFCPTLIARRTLGYNIINEIRILGPIYGEDQLQNSRITSLLFDQPMTTTPEISLQPLLFTDPIPGGTWLEDGRFSFIFTLRNNIKWHDGRDFSAEDIVFTFNSIRHPQTISSNAKNKIEGIHSMEAFDGNRLAVYFNTPYSGNLGFLTFNILPRYYFTAGQPPPKNDDFFAARPVGTGRFKIDGDYYPRRIDLIRNDDYFFKEEIPKNIDRVSVRVREDLSMAIQSFIIDEPINFFPDVPPSEVTDLQALRNVEVIPYNEYSWQFIAFNLRRDAFKDKALRKAINLAVDKEDFNDDIYLGRALTITGPFPPLSPYYNRMVWETPDIEKAKDILLQNGYISQTIDGVREKDGVPLRFRLAYEKTGDMQREHLITKFTQAMRLIGIEIQVDPLETDNFDKKIREERDFDMVLFEFYFGTDPNITPIFHSDYDRVRGFNVCGLRDPDIDRLLDEVRLKQTTEDIRIIYQELHRVIAEKYVGVFLWQTPKYIAFDNRHFEGIRDDTIDRINIFRFIHKW